MRNPAGKTPTIGFISTWPVYQGTTIDRYAHSLIQGISAAASKEGCNLLLGCGFSVTGNDLQRRSFWPVPGPGMTFLPIGPWNTDGLIIVPDELNIEQSRYVRDLLDSGFPIIFTTPEGPGPVVAVDNQLGIQQAFTHLYEHGHRQIAFIAGNSGRGGDSEERLRAYQSALRDVGLTEDPDLIAFGEHRKDGGAAAMQRIIAGNRPFTALIASNDLSCLGAIECLLDHGRRIPDDVAVIGFDDILDARSLSPSLTTVRHPTFSIGYQSVLTLLEGIRGDSHRVSKVVPSRLIVRQSCGCSSMASAPSRKITEPAIQLKDLSLLMAETSLIEARNSPVEELEIQCQSFIEALIESLRVNEAGPIMKEIELAMTWTDEREEDAHIWQAGMSVLYQHAGSLTGLASPTDEGQVASLLDRVHIEISDQIQQRATRTMLGHMDRMAQLGMMTAELLTALNITESADILARHMPKVGIRDLLVGLYDGGDDELTSHARVLIDAGLEGVNDGLRFETRKFPIAEIHRSREPFQLTILPLDMDGATPGFVAFNAPNPELCAAVVHNLNAAIRTSQLYRDALEGRQLAEDASRLKSRFLSMVSHELRTPLSLIIGLSEIILREQQEGRAQPKLRDVEQIHLSAQHLARLIGDVLDLASSEAGQLHILREPLDLGDVLQVTVQIGEQLAREKGLAWSADLPSHGPRVMGDRTRLRQITLNLISNAVKFTTAGRVHFEVRTSNESVTISVSDTGMGIPAAELSTIFDEFYRSYDAVQSGEGGMGLGLAITRQLVEQHGGSIEVHSPGQLGPGSTFSFTLPILAGHDLQNDLTPTLHRGNNHVMILSEKGDDLAAVHQYLQASGFEIEICDMDNNWLSRIMALSPIAVLLTEQLGSREGWSISGILKRQPATKNTLVLAFSLDHGQVLKLDYLHKPLDPETLTRELERLQMTGGGSATVLVVDDDPGILEMHSRLIEGSGRYAVTARNGREALKSIEQGIPDLILLDLMMPEMDGFAVLDELRSREATRDIPVIVLTARVLSDADLERCNRGVAAILGKGLFSAEETLKHVETALTQKQTLGKATQTLVRRAMAFIHDRFAGALTREQIADHVGVSADYLTDCFHQELGITPSTYIRRYRVRQACELLRNTDQSITQVAMTVGFSDGAHFTRTFQREVGMTPRAYRVQGWG